MMEIKLCPYCRAYNLPGHRCRSAHIAERACSDCEAYAPLSGMITKPDGRVICRTCQTKLDRLAAKKAQPDLFVEQKGLFQ